MTIQSTPPVHKNPTDILQEQANCLLDICKIQQEQLELLRSQNEYLQRTLQVITKQASPSELLHVKVEDINMPYWALVGFLIKWTFAWIPAGIIMGILFYIIVLILS